LSRAVTLIIVATPQDTAGKTGGKTGGLTFLAEHFILVPLQ
jgi:hypothetical protein